jgi:hypothetical protein
VRESAGAIKNTVTGAVDEVRTVYQRATNGVRQALDLRQHVRDYPWASVGAATFAGFLSGFLSPRTSEPAVHRIAVSGNGSASATASTRSVIGHLGDVIKRELANVGEVAILAAANALKNTVQSLAADFRLSENSRFGHHNGRHAETF